MGRSSMALTDTILWLGRWGQSVRARPGRGAVEKDGAVAMARLPLRYKELLGSNSSIL